MPTTTAGRTPRRKAATTRPAAARKAARPSDRRPTAPSAWRARVRMYRHGLGDCFLVSFARPGTAPLQMLIDCGALSRNKAQMAELVQRVRDHVLADAAAAGVPAVKARLDLVVATHEHLDHVSGFNQAREVFEKDFDIGGVWMAWTEDTGSADVARVKALRARAVAGLQALVARAAPGSGQSVGLALGAAASQAADLLAFSVADPTVGTGTVAEAMDYLKQRGRRAGHLRFLKPGEAPFSLPAAGGAAAPVRVYVLGPPADPAMFKISTVTDQMKRDEVVYHLSAAGPAGVDALTCALDGASAPDADRRQPFNVVHRIKREVLNNADDDSQPYPGRDALRALLATTYDRPDQAWRRVDDDWLGAFGQLALNLDNDTNNTSLVLAFEFTDRPAGEVLLFVADAQIGSWLSWRDMRFKLPDGAEASTADLLRRTVFYKVGHHSSHNATAKEGGLELMDGERLVAFVPLDMDTAKSKGRKGADGKPKGWDMPAEPLRKGLERKTSRRLVFSDLKTAPPQEALDAGVVVSDTHIDYFLS